MSLRQVELRWGKETPFDKAQSHSLFVNGDLAYALYMIIEREAQATRNELLYIGIVKSDYRGLLQRMSEHRKDWIARLMKKSGIFVKFAMVYSNEPATEALIEDTESALVFGRNPPENTTKMKSYSLWGDRDLVVTNLGAGRYLAKQYSTKLQRENGTAGILR